MKRCLAIGDIHGCFDALRRLCEFVELRPEDTLVTLGDYVNRGPDTRAVLDWLIDLDGFCDLQPLRGNHEIMLLHASQSEVALERWREHGGAVTLRSYAASKGEPGTLADIPEAHWDFLNRRLLPYYEMETHIFVHASVYADLPLTEQPEYVLYWVFFDDPPLHESGKIMVCGHSTQKSGLPLTNGNAICIDTWACGQGWLTCLDAGSGQIWQANQQGETRMLQLDELEPI